MNAIKNALVTTTLVAVGYGVWVILSTPNGPTEFSGPEDVDGWVMEETGPIAANGLQPPQLTLQHDLGGPTDGEAPTEGGLEQPLAAPGSRPGGPAPSNDTQTYHLDAPQLTDPQLQAWQNQSPGNPYVAAQVSSQQPAAEAPTNTADDPSADGDLAGATGVKSEGHAEASQGTTSEPPPTADAVPPRGAPDAQDLLENAIVGNSASVNAYQNDAAAPANPENVSSVTGPEGTSPPTSADSEGQESQAFQTAWQTAQRQIQNSELPNALFTLSIWYQDSSLTEAQREQCLQLLDELAGEVIYSRRHHLQPPYTIRTGDSLEGIADQFQIPALFLARVNGIGPPYQLESGDSLKVIQGPFRAEIDTRRREMTLFAGSYYAGRFPLQLGQDAAITTGRFEVVSKTIDPSYTHPKTGEKIPGGDPRNPYGRFWLGLRNETTPPDMRLGLHGAPEQVPADDPRGSIRLSSRDVDDLQAILSLGSAVIIR